MTGQTYRMNLPTLGVRHIDDGHRILVTIPVGSLIVMEDWPLDEMRVVNVTWNGVAAMMFTDDVRDRGTRIKESARSASSASR
jgi:hypothetical protein